jgi:uncharacterized protein YbjQ (UPF0145 family)
MSESTETADALVSDEADAERAELIATLEQDRWPALRSLTLRGGALGEAALRRLLKTAAMNKLRRLELGALEVSADAIVTMMRHPSMSQVEVFEASWTPREEEDLARALYALSHVNFQRGIPLAEAPRRWLERVCEALRERLGDESPDPLLPPPLPHDG